MDISIIIPTLNEEGRIGKLLNCLKEIAPGCEIIVVDGGSSDQTCEIVSKHARLFTTQCGRGTQMNYGAGKARGEVLWFLHADSIPHRNSLSALKNALTDPLVVGGAFTYEFDEPGWNYRVWARVSNHKNKLKNKIYGDMGIFVRRKVFRALGGYKEARLMEDFEFGRRLKTVGEIRILDPMMKTSGRQLSKVGPLRKTIKDSVIKIGYDLGVSSDKLYEWYYGK